MIAVASQAMEVPVISVTGLTKRFGGLIAVRELDFDLAAGEVLGIIGPNGAGKSTSFNLIAGALKPDSGDIAICGVTTTRAAPHLIVELGVARTFQHNMPFEGMTMIENVMVGATCRLRGGLWHPILRSRSFVERESAARRRAEEWLDFVGLGAEKDTEVRNLSFGQGRLLELARAMMSEPKAILLDEPAAGLTPAECDRLSQIILEIKGRGVAVLLIEHDMHFLLPLCDRVLVLNFGRRIAMGTPQEVRSHPAVIEAYLGESQGVGDA